MSKRKLPNPPQKYQVGEFVQYRSGLRRGRGKILSARLYGPRVGWYYKIEGLDWYVREDEIEMKRK